ncbi:MAG: sulfatase-like hydrolase/transferase [candidate division Zixibacteria bacterium]|nr:sulfatase-like hydrolase/transferase [candidate division Zixibacteria bacterium]MDD5425818.1 sulfatase-like hydrolase/transferase [candidate division Zixibacteria bacterium]
MIKTRFISVPAVYVLITAAVLVLFLALWRFILMLLSGGLSSAVPGDVLFKAFIVGLRFDFIIVSYIGTVIYVLGIIPFIDIQRSKFMRRLGYVLLFVYTAVIFFVHLADIEFFKFFNTRLNGMALIWQDTPEFVITMIWGMYPVIKYLILYAVILAAFFLLMRRLQRKVVTDSVKSHWLVNLLFAPVLLTVFIIGTVGRLGSDAPLRWGAAYFSEYDYANLLALNPVYTFVRDFFYDAGSKEQVKKLVAEMTFPEAENEVRRLLGLPADSAAYSSPIVREVNFNPPEDNPANVIFIIMESQSSHKIGVLANKYPWQLSPCFDSLAEKSILFTNFYATGMHTYCGLISAIYGNPHLFGKVIIKQVSGENHFRGLPSILKQHGYETHFFSTQDPHFDNMMGFMKANGFMYYYSIYDYDQSHKLSHLGVPDHIMYDSAYAKLRRLEGRPFLATLLTTSNHGPWRVPDVSFERIPDTAYEAERQNAFKYADWALGQFINKIENDPYYYNTLLVITGDHGFFYNPTSDLDLSFFEVPLLIHRVGWGKEHAQRNDRLGSHLDIVATIMGQLRFNYHNYTFGHDLLDTVTYITDFVHTTEWYKIGYIEKDYYLIVRLDGPESLFRLPNRTDDVAAFHPEIVESYKKKALALYQTAYYNMKRPLPEK